MKKIINWFKGLISKPVESSIIDIQNSNSTVVATISGNSSPYTMGTLKSYKDLLNWYETLPTEEEVINMQKKSDNALMFYDNYEEWFLFNIPTDNPIRYDVYQEIAKITKKFLKSSSCVYNNETYICDTIWFKKDSKTGLSNFIKKYKKTGLFLYSISEDQYRIIVKAARAPIDFQIIEDNLK